MIERTEESNPEEENWIPGDILQDAHAIYLEVLPEKSRVYYKTEYDIFIKWCDNRYVKILSFQPFGVKNDINGMKYL